MDAGISSSPENIDFYYKPEPYVLLVDDDKDVLFSLARVLSLSGKNYNIKTAETAEDALSLIEQNNIDIVVTDLKLPGEDGLSLLRKLKDLSPHSRSILMTAYGTEDIIREAGSCGVSAYIEKPFGVDTLLGHIEASLKSDSLNTGNLANVEIGDVVEIYGGKKDSTLLSVRNAGSSGILIIEDGIITHARCGELSGEEALEQILSLKNCVISSFRGEITCRRTLSVPLAPIKSVRRGWSNAEKGEKEGMHQVASSEGSENAEKSENVVSDEVRELIDEGIRCFSLRRFKEAKEAWFSALRLDPQCLLAKKNLAVLYSVLRAKKSYR